MLLIMFQDNFWEREPLLKSGPFMQELSKMDDSYTNESVLKVAMLTRIVLPTEELVLFL